nr:amino acid ABC transporter ATP-binding protein [uncultured Desulfobacter sp.]
MNQDPIVIIDKLHKSFNGIEVLQGISLTAHKGEVISILGSSGSGKSTLLRCINFLENPDSGVITVCGTTVHTTTRRGECVPTSNKAVTELRRKVGMVFQSFNLWDHMTVIENIMEAQVHVHKVPKDQARQRGMALLEKVGLQDRSDAYPGHLSGGQKQRVAIARALAVTPKVLLFDEPTSALDPELVGEVLAVIRDLAAEGMTMLIVTHEINFARDVSNRVIFLHEGKIEEQGPPAQVIGNPESHRCRNFLAQYLERDDSGPVSK